MQCASAVGYYDPAAAWCVVISNGSVMLANLSRQGSELDEDALREKLESLLAVYQQLLEVTTGERQAIFEEMSQINQAKNASKVYHLFG